MLIKTRLILNDAKWTLSSCVSITARFIKENIQDPLHIKDVMLNSVFKCVNAVSQSIDVLFRSVCLQLL